MSLEFAVNGEQIRKALAAIEKAEANGFMHCMAVFDLKAVGNTISGMTVEFSDLIEKAHPTDGHFNWGRFQGVTRNNRFDNEKQELIPINHPRS